LYWSVIMSKIKGEDLKQWGFYLTRVPYWDKGSISFIFKVRLVLIYRMVGGDAIALPITSNGTEGGKTREIANLEWLK